LKVSNRRCNLAKGKVIQVIGTVVDVEFPQEELPAIYNALEIMQDGEKIVLETVQHIGNNWVRCLSLCPTEGLQRGAVAVDTGAPISVYRSARPPSASLIPVFGISGQARR
jgi:F-type H+-transporting ATPase subunit beta